MDFFQHRYYRLNKILLTFIGHWPYQSTGSRYGYRAAGFILGINQVVPISLAFVKYHHEPGIVLELAVPILFGTLYIVKLIGFMCHAQKVRSILENYIEKNTAMGIIAYTIFIIQPTIPKIIDVFLKNGTKPGQFPYPVDYYHLDVQKYYFYIVVYSYIAVSMLSVVVATHSIMLICYMHHVCGIFAALGHKLERFGHNRKLLESEEIRYAVDRRDMELLTLCIDRHIHAFEYANLIGESYTRTFFITVGLGTVLFNVIGIQILTKRNDPESAIRLVTAMMYLLSYFFIECYISEKLLDHSTGIFFRIQNSQWYTLSLKAQKLLQFMTMRCSIPCQLTAGKMLPMTMRSWWLTLKTSGSYLMVVRSMQEL